MPARSSPSTIKVGARGAGRYAAESHRKAAHATREGWFKDEILPVAIPQKKGAPIVVRSRRSRFAPTRPREALAALKPAFKKDGTVTAGNAPGVNDGASALVVMCGRHGARARRRRRWRASSARRRAACAPKLVLMTPVEAVRTRGAEGRLGARRRRSVRAQRSVLGPGGRGAARARHRRPRR